MKTTHHIITAHGGSSAHFIGDYFHLPITLKYIPWTIASSFIVCYLLQHKNFWKTPCIPEMFANARLWQLRFRFSCSHLNGATTKNLFKIRGTVPYLAAVTPANWRQWLLAPPSLTFGNQSLVFLTTVPASVNRDHSWWLPWKCC